MKFSLQTKILIRKLEEALYKKNLVWKAITLFTRYMKSFANPWLEYPDPFIWHGLLLMQFIEKEDLLKFKQWAEMISFKYFLYSCNVFNIRDRTLSSHEQLIKGSIKTHCDYSLRRMFMTLPFVFYLLNVFKHIMRIYMYIISIIGWSLTYNKWSIKIVYYQVQIHVIQP